MTWWPRSADAAARRYRFYDPCFGPTRESLALPADVRAAAASLDGRRLTVSDALTALMKATEPHGGHLELPGGEHRIIWYKPTGGAYGDAHVFFLIKFG